MNKPLRTPRIALASVAWLLSSCAGVSPLVYSGGSAQHDSVEVRPVFHDGAAADIVLRFFTWDSIYMTKPDSRERDYLPLFGRADIEREVRRRDIPRNTAVVVISRLYRDQAQITQLSRDWAACLNNLGFRRVVLLHAGTGADINGLPVLYDSTVAGGDVDGPP